jgi:hypothetical protein
VSLRGAFSRERWLFVLGVTTEAWAERWDLEPYTRPCGECGALCMTTRPFAVGNLRGLASPPCPCGNERTPYCVVTAAGDLLDPD